LFKALIGCTTVFLSLLFIAFGFYYWMNHFNWYPDSFFIKKFENHTAITIENNTEIIWKWAAPRGGDWKSHYVTAVFVHPTFDPLMLGDSFRPQQDCYQNSGGAKRFLTESSPMLCWRDSLFTNENEWFLVLYAPEESILLFKKSTR